MADGSVTNSLLGVASQSGYVPCFQRLVPFSNPSILSPSGKWTGFPVKTAILLCLLLLENPIVATKEAFLLSTADDFFLDANCVLGCCQMLLPPINTILSLLCLLNLPQSGIVIFHFLRRSYRCIPLNSKKWYQANYELCGQTNTWEICDFHRTSN